MKLVENSTGIRKVVKDDYVLSADGFVDGRTGAFCQEERFISEEEAIPYINNCIFNYLILDSDYQWLKKRFDKISGEIIHLLNGYTKEELLENNLADLGIREECNE